MQLGLTIPLQRHLKIRSLPYGAPLSGNYCWEAHCITLHGRKSLLAVHAASRFSFVLFDLSAADWQSIANCFLQGLRASFASAGILQMQTEAYLQCAGTVMLTKTHGRREVAFLNRAWEDAMAHDCTIDLAQQEQPLLGGVVNGLLRRCAGYEGLGDARARLLHTLGLCGNTANPP